MKAYRRMTWTDRLIIEKYFNAGRSYREIARVLGFSVSSVHREIQRGLYDHLDSATYLFIKRYSAKIAQDDADFQATAKGRPIKLDCNYAYARHVASRIINDKESPDAIAGDLKARGEWTVSASTLYRYIDSGFIPQVTNKHLSRRKRKYNRVRKASRAPQGTSIEQRPAYINARETPFHWEMDTVIGKAKGKGQALLVLTERLTRYEVIYKLSAKSSAAVLSKMGHFLKNYPVLSITVDNGSEFSSAHSLPVPVYYCHPYSAYERGSNENANKLVRRFFPKGASMSRRTQRDADAAAHYINNMHRKVLGYHTAQELFDAYCNSI